MQIVGDHGVTRFFQCIPGAGFFREVDHRLSPGAHEPGGDHPRGALLVNRAPLAFRVSFGEGEVKALLIAFDGLGVDPPVA
ncbi:hypothetical protein D3C87_2102210 [compost metagenome]